MYLVEFLLAKPPMAPQALEGASLEALRSLCLPQDGVEHIRIHTSRAGARGVFFCRAPDLDQAVSRTYAVCRRALELRPEFRGWEITRVTGAL
ncbi:hypothetical protein ACIQV3_37850 [Streptomyces sp. NPDC099050]|uniref:hypothetical protein n=1 Tax=Streptomyces sp. NPDC099050 TaxID=3366100 RepID=UPI003822796D